MQHFNYLLEFQKVAELQSFSQAADELYLSLSTLSRHISALERDLGIVLISRSSHSVKITAAGEHILQYVPRFASFKQAIESEISLLSEKSTNEIRIAALPVMALYDIPGLIAEFNEEFPTYSVSLSEETDITDALSTGKYDYAFSYERYDSPNLEHLSYCKDRYAVVLPGNHRLAKEDGIRLEWLRDCTFLSNENSRVLNDTIRKLCMESGFEPKFDLTHNVSWGNLVSMVEWGYGIAIMTKRVALGANRYNVAVLDLVPVVEKDLFLIREKNRKQSKGAQVFWNFVKSSICPPQPTANLA